MIESFLADLVMILHLFFIVFVGLGGLLALRWHWTSIMHLPALAWGVYIALTGGVCPLTPLENALRRAAGEAGYSGGFIAHYLTSVIYPAGLTVQLQVVLAAAAVLLNLIVYGIVWRRLRR